METRQPFSNDYLSNIYGMLEYQAKRGTPWDYEVRIDHFVAVPRTSDPYQFYDYEHVLNDTACELVVLVFKGHSRVSDKYILTIKEPPLAGVVFTEAQVQEMLRKEKIEFYTKMEIRHLRDKIRDQKRCIKELTKALAGAGNNEQISKTLKELTGSPLLRSLFTPAGPSQPLNGVDAAQAVDGLPDAEVMNLLRHYRAQLGEDTFQALLGTVLTMAQEPELIPAVRKFITDKNKRK